MLKKVYNHFMTDSLYRSSIFVMASTFVMAVLGFFFWIVVARLFPAKSVGIATTLISAVTLLSNFSLLGFNVGLLRYLPKSTKKNQLINSVTVLVVIASIISSVIFISGLRIFSPKLSFMQTNPLYTITFILFVIGLSCSTILDSIFMANRASGNVLIKSTVLSILKLAFPLVLVIVGAYGIFASVAIATIVGSIVGFAILIFNFSYSPQFKISKQVIKDMGKFSSGSYIAGFLSQAPALILPIFIINRLSATTAAYFYMDMMMLGFLTIISMASTQSLLAEGSHDETKLMSHVVKTISIMALFLIPAVVVMTFFGNLILHAFGKNYATDAFSFLQLISISAIFMAVSSLGNSIQRVRHQIKGLIVINFISALLVLGLAYIFINHGLVGVGLGWLIGRVVIAAIYLFILRKDLINLPLLNKNLLKLRFSIVDSK